jgi:hypothetical protein
MPYHSPPLRKQRTDLCRRWLPPYNRQILGQNSEGECRPEFAMPRVENQLGQRPSIYRATNRVDKPILSFTRRFKQSAFAHFLIVLAFGEIGGCSTPPPQTDYVHVIPMQYIPPTGTGPSRFGWIPTDLAYAESFRVEVGNKQYFELLNRAGPEHIKDELARFAEGEVFSRGFCASGVARTERPQIVGPRSREYVWVGVKCVDAQQ